MGTGKRYREALNSEAVHFGGGYHPWQCFVTKVISHQYLAPPPQIRRETRKKGEGGEDSHLRDGVGWDSILDALLRPNRGDGAASVCGGAGG